MEAHRLVSSDYDADQLKTEWSKHRKEKPESAVESAVKTFVKSKAWGDIKNEWAPWVPKRKR